MYLASKSNENNTVNAKNQLIIFISPGKSTISVIVSYKEEINIYNKTW